MPNIIKVGGGGLNTKDLAPNVTSLTLTGGNAKIDVSFRGVAAEYLPLVRYYRVVGKVGGIPTSPTDGVYVDVAPGTAGNATKSTTLTGLTNGVQYTVRVYIRCTYGWQTSPDAKGVATPMAGIQIQTLPIGSFVKLNENGVGVNYRIVNQGRPSSMYDVSCDGAWLLREDIAENRQWHSSNVNDYANSTIKAYLNSTFLNRFSANIKAAIKQVKIPYRPGSAGASVNSGANGLSCKAFLLSGYEMGLTSADFRDLPPEGAKLAYFEAGKGESANNKRIAYLGGSATSWWMRSPDLGGSGYSAWLIIFNGDGNSNGCSAIYGARPALVLPSDFLLNPTPNPDGSYSPLVA